MVKAVLQQGLFVSFEGIEGSGKSSQIKHVAAWLAEQNIPHTVTREPGGTDFAERIRTILLDKDGAAFDPYSEFLLFAAARRDHVRRVIAPALNDKKVVLCDRFMDASAAYQGYGHQIDLPVIHQVNQWVCGVHIPHLTFVLDISIEDSERRLNTRQQSYRDRMERLDSGFFSRARQGYLELAKDNAKRIKVLDGSVDEKTLFEQVRLNIEQHLESV